MKYIHIMNSADALKANILHEKKIIKEVSIFLKHLETLKNLERMGYEIHIREKKLLIDAIDSLMSQLNILNDSLPEIIEKISFFKEIPSEKEEKKEEKKKREKLISLKYKHPAIKEKEALVTIKKKDRLKFLRELNLTDSSVKRLKKQYKIEEIKFEEFKKPNIYAKISNKLFSRLSSKALEKGYFAKLRYELRKSNLPFLSQTYLSMTFFSSLISIFVAIILVVILLFFSLSIDFPFLTATEESIILRFAKNFWLIFIVPALTFLVFYFYPSIEKKSIAGKINQELPFVVIHMSAIAGSGIEPVKIFKIIVMSQEYPNTRKEIKKLLNQINLYGYDLVSALRESARVTSSSKLTELFNGLATTITSGGSLTGFLDKRAESLVLDYRMEREKYNKTTETFMDIYISVVIAAPMIMTLLLVLMSLTGLSFGLGIGALSLLMMLGIALLNVLFLVFLHLKQPEF